ncbi:TetR/AcrR family transcriptional regulator [Mycobacterium sp. CBMA293]|uniref:TetR/AcrR family transcriptional regulator n=1 Tax=unclassified Mycolicibacterium TaxID=2636767 RepID=UPI001323B275|nr:MULTISPECIES: TetR/AcrR family transcriptional regulator [unclassified Mycolicibacterium]MUL46186.1 TetR/AcrR family transcriptional regulator [Mycolicibacterium sp. CBMA 360]MUL94123.1 TetR/AcrR family transcriptional regulator [Mycolicibacterium sp. CBMA 230]MUM32530.1 TetR/AcrR family transcriptional regulator [Mycolicibacterium sp. CBMA 361]MUL58765.1 TetR/AcrR family transcriptional regulator [Mycolicibacterium sp. CBMA 335]MUL69159.1 TetR/AcrR family transcriptional regulator [Mycolic
MAPSDRFRARKQPKQQRSAETRQRILEAAAHVFAEFGYRGGTTNRIAEAADISIGSLYQYFPNKDAILAALTDAHIDAGATLLVARVAAGMPTSLEDQLRLFTRATIDNHRDDPHLHQVLFAEAPRSPALLTRLRDAEESAVTTAHELLAQHPEVRVPDLKFAARLTVATIESLTHRLIACPQPADAQQLEDSIVAMLATYLRG